MSGSGGGTFGGKGSRLKRTSVARGFMLALCFGVFATLGSDPTSAQSYSFDSVQISGNQRIEADTILSYAGIARGQAVSAGELNAAAQNIRATGLFEAVDLVPQGSTLIISVTEYPTINRINFEGNSRLSDDQLAPLIRSTERRVYSPTQAEADVDAIIAAYAAEGRINATVTPQIIRREDNRVDLVFEVFEGGVTEVERISFVGNRNFSDQRLRGILETKQAGLLRMVMRADTFVADRIDFDRRALTDFYNARGYPDFTIQNVDVGLTRERDAYLITFNVVEGQQFRFGNITMSSEIPEADAARYRAAIRLSPGSTYSPVLIDNEIARIEDMAFRDGVNFLRVEPRITRDDRNQLLNVEFALVRGERIFVERIDIEGNNTTLDRVVRAQFDQVEGDPFNPRAVRESAERIRALGYFSDAQVNTRPGSRDDQVVVDVDVVEAPTGSLSFGANYSTDNGVGLLASFNERNFLGRGQELTFQINTARSNRQFTFDFAEPRFLGRDLRFGFDLRYRTTDNDNALYDTENFRFAPSFQFPVSDNGRLNVFAATEMTQMSDVEGQPSDLPEDRASLLIFDEAAEGRVWTQSIGYSYTYDTRRSRLDTPGSVLLRFGQEFGFGDKTFIETSALATAERLVLGESVTLRATVEGGVLSYSDGDSRVTDRYFLGGRIMRGFEPNGIGPRDADTGDALGGNVYAVARLEAEFPLGIPEEYGMSGGAFVDYGSVWDVGNLRSLDPDDVLYDDYTPRAVIGVSLFWNTPIGPLRFNFTEPLMAEEEDETRFFDLTVSTTF